LLEGILAIMVAEQSESHAWMSQQEYFSTKAAAAYLPPE